MGKNKEKCTFFHFFEKKSLKNLVESKNSRTFATAIKNDA